MEKQSELRCIYKGEYTVYQREAMYCFFKGRREQQTLSLEESLAMGVIVFVDSKSVGQLF